MNKGTVLTSKGGMSSKLYEANMVLSLNHKHNFNILKNRYSGISGPVSTDQAVEQIAGMLVAHVFKGSMDMFQETMKMKLIEQINDIISGNDIIPKGDIKKCEPHLV